MADGAQNNDIGFRPSPEHYNLPTVIVVVIMSFIGCLFLVGAILFGICYFLKKDKKKKKTKKMVEGTDDIDVDEHMRVQEMVAPGPHGRQTVAISVEDDVNVHEKMRKNEIDMVGKGLHAAGSASSGGSTQHQSHPEHRV